MDDIPSWIIALIALYQLLKSEYKESKKKKPQNQSKRRKRKR